MRNTHVVGLVVSCLLSGAGTVGAAANKGAPPAAVKMIKHGETPAAQLGTLSPGTGVANGTTAPKFSVKDALGKTVTSDSLLGKDRVLLMFYRGGWCPFCNFQMHEMATAAAEFKKRNVTVVAVSVDQPAGAAAFQQAHTAPFLVLSDPDLAAHKAFHVIHHVDDGEYAQLQKFGIQLEKASGKTHHDIAVPSIFILDAKGTVVWGHANPDYQTRPTVAQLLSVLDQPQTPAAKQ